MALPARLDGREFATLTLTAHETACAICNRSLQVTQWRDRAVERLDGVAWLIMRDKRCPDLTCSARRVIFRAPEECQIVLKKDTVGIDVLIEIGLLHLEKHMPFRAIVEVLAERGVHLTERGASEAYKRFLALIHCRAGESEQVREKLRKQGGMIVLIDGVQYDDRSSVMYVVTDVRSHTTLFVERHDARSAEALAPLLARNAVNVSMFQSEPS